MLPFTTGRHEDPKLSTAILLNVEYLKSLFLQSRLRGCVCYTESKVISILNVVIICISKLAQNDVTPFF
jgi:hypothetical protein